MFSQKKNEHPMPTLNSKRVQLAAAALDVDFLGKRERQALASTYEEAVRRNAKSVQVEFITSRFGRRVMKTSVYLQWPAAHAYSAAANGEQEMDDIEQETCENAEAQKNAPKQARAP